MTLGSLGAFHPGPYRQTGDTELSGGQPKEGNLARKIRNVKTFSAGDSTLARFQSGTALTYWEVSKMDEVQRRMKTRRRFLRAHVCRGATTLSCGTAWPINGYEWMELGSSRSVRLLGCQGTQKVVSRVKARLFPPFATKTRQKMGLMLKVWNDTQSKTRNDVGRCHVVYVYNQDAAATPALFFFCFFSASWKETGCRRRCCLRATSTETSI